MLPCITYLTLHCSTYPTPPDPTLPYPTNPTPTLLCMYPPYLTLPLLYSTCTHPILPFPNLSYLPYPRPTLRPPYPAQKYLKWSYPYPILHCLTLYSGVFFVIGTVINQHQELFLFWLQVSKTKKAWAR